MCIRDRYMYIILLLQLPSLNSKICTCFFLYMYICTSLVHVSAAGYYVKVMKKIQDKGDKYVKNESERLG